MNNDTEQLNTNKRVRVDLENAFVAILELREQLGELERLKFSDFRGAWLPNVNLRGQDISEAIFTDANLSKASMESCNASKTLFNNANLNDAKLERSVLRAANMKGAELQNADISSADFRGANLTKINLKNVYGVLAKFEGANLSYANFDKAYITVANFDGANLSNAQLSNADISYCSFRGADFSDAYFDEATDLTNSDFKGAALRETDLSTLTISVQQLEQMFGDATVILPHGKGPKDPEWPSHWSKEELDFNDFPKQWRAFQKAGGFDPDNPN